MRGPWVRLPIQPAGEVGRTASNWLISDLFGALNRLGKDIADSPVSPSVSVTGRRHSRNA